MKESIPIGFSDPERMDNQLICNNTYTKEQAEKANLAFDDAVKRYLHNWIEQGTVSGVDPGLEADIDAFIEQGALRSFFKHHDDSLERLLQQEDIACHLLRPWTQVFFEPDAYEPLLAKFEKRIYNLAAHREHLDVSFRYSPTSRQGAHGDSIGLDDMPAGEAHDDIGYYFGTRRSDATALNLLARQLRSEALFSTPLPIHVMAEGYMEDSLRAVRKATEQLRDEGFEALHCFVIHRRHAADDRHLGAALLLMDTRQPNKPQRVLFCDTLKPNGLPPWWDKFKRYLDSVFPQDCGEPAASERLEDGGVNLQRLHDGVPVRHQDIDCAFYTAATCQALIQIARQSPEVLIDGPLDTLVCQMTERMPAYFEQANAPRSPHIVREVNVIRRWQTGQEALADYQRAYLETATVQISTPPELDQSNWDAAESSVASQDLWSAA